MHLADNSIYITIATILATFNITKEKGPDGKEIYPETDFVGFVRSVQSEKLQRCAWAKKKFSHPLPFRCSIKPRSDAAARLIEETASEYGFL